MKKIFLCLALYISLISGGISTRAADAAPPPERSVPERLEDLEAYANNGARNASTNAPSKIAGPGPGHNAFQMVSAALVLFMTLPGLALFYGGLVRRKNVLSVLAQCLGIAGLVTILWWLCGYSLTFHSGETERGWSIIGKLDWKFLSGVDSNPNPDYAAWVSHNVYSMYQLMFAIITPALSMVLCMVGTGMLWVGWYGFNAGSAVAADVIAANAFTTTTLATAVASFVWPMAEWVVRGKPSVLGFCSGAVAGLVVITPACGFVTPAGALIIGVAAGIVPFFFCYKVKAWFGYDDALDTFGVHAIGGTLGAFLTGALARNAANGNLATNLKDYVKDRFFQPLVWEQLKAILLTLLLAVVGTTVIAFAVKAGMGLRPVEDV